MRYPDVIFNPQAGNETVKNGTVLVGSPNGIGSGSIGPNYRIDSDVSNLPTSVEVYNNKRNRFRTQDYYTGFFRTQDDRKYSQAQHMLAFYKSVWTSINTYTALDHSFLQYPSTSGRNRGLGTTRPQQPGRALTFTSASGTTAAVDANISPSSTAVTVSIWGKTAAFPTGKAIAGGVNSNDYIRFETITILRLRINEINYGFGNPSTHWNDGEWNHLLITLDNGVGKAYINGVWLGTSAVIPTEIPWDLGRLGGYNSAPSVWDGEIFDYQIFNRVLSESEITAMYRQGKEPWKSIEGHPNDPNHRWLLDDNSTSWGKNSGSDADNPSQSMSYANIALYENADVPFSRQNLRGYTGGVLLEGTTAYDLDDPVDSSYSGDYSIGIRLFVDQLASTFRIFAEKTGGGFSVFARHASSLSIYNGSWQPFNTDLTTGFHTFVLSFDSVNEIATLYVDGVAATNTVSLAAAGIPLLTNSNWTFWNEAVTDGTIGEGYRFDFYQGQFTAAQALAYHEDNYDVLRLINPIRSIDFSVDYLDEDFTIQNEVGSAYIPVGVDNETDIAGYAAQNVGRVPRNGELINSTCGEFDQIDDFVDFGSDVTTDNFTTSETNCSFCFWHDFPTGQNTNGHVAGFGVYANNHIFAFWKGATGLTGVMSARGSSGGQNLNIDVTPYLDTLTHVCCVLDGPNQTATCYLNGKSVGTLNLASTQIPDFTAATRSFRVGASSGSTLYFLGKMFGLTSYNKTLSAEEVLYCYTGGDRGENPTSQNLILDAPFSENHGEKIHDVSGNDYHGTLSGATLSTFWVSTQSKYHRHSAFGCDTAAEFNNTDAYITCGVNFVDETIDVAQTFFVRFNPRYLASLQPVFGAATFGGVVLTPIDGTKTRVTYRGVIDIDFVGAVVDSDCWNDAVVIIDSDNNVTLYLNGVKYGPNAAGSLPDPANEILIGRQTTQYFEGEIADFSYLTRAATEREALDFSRGVFPSDVEAIYKLDGNALDSSGNGNDGTENGGLIYVETPARNDGSSFVRVTPSNPSGRGLNTADSQLNMVTQSLAPWSQRLTTGFVSFDGVDAYLNITQNSISLVNGQYSMCGWLKHNGTQLTGNGYIIVTEDNLGLFYSDEVLSLDLGNGAIEWVFPNATTSSEFRFWTVTRDDSGFWRAYVDGVELTYSSGNQTETDSPAIEAIGGTVGNYCLADMRGIRFFDRTLSQGEISDLYEEIGNEPYDAIHLFPLDTCGIDIKGSNNGVLEGGYSFSTVTLETAYDRGDARTSPNNVTQTITLDSEFYTEVKEYL